MIRKIPTIRLIFGTEIINAHSTPSIDSLKKGMNIKVNKACNKTRPISTGPDRNAPQHTLTQTNGWSKPSFSFHMSTFYTHMYMYWTLPLKQRPTQFFLQQICNIEIAYIFASFCCKNPNFRSKKIRLEPMKSVDLVLISIILNRKCVHVAFFKPTSDSMSHRWMKIERLIISERDYSIYLQKDPHFGPSSLG